MPREYTEDECREMFLAHCRSVVHYWASSAVDRACAATGEPAPTVEDRISGAIFSVLVALDGGSGLPGFIVAPDPDPEDREFYASQGENWWPENRELAVKADISGRLHELFYRKEG